jgi:hypothetical protein
MGGFGKVFGKVLDFAKPFLTAINPLLGVAAGFASGLMQGKNPLQAALGAATDLFPGGGVLKNVLGQFGGSGLLDGAGGNSLLSGALNLATGKEKVTDVVKDFVKNAAEKSRLTQMGIKNAQELAAQRMAQLQLQ